MMIIVIIISALTRKMAARMRPGGRAARSGRDGAELRRRGALGLMLPPSLSPSLPRPSLANVGPRVVAIDSNSGGSVLYSGV